MGSGFRAGDMSVSSSSGASAQQHTRHPDSDLVKVHTSPVKPFHVPSIQSIFQTMPKLYKYSHDQVEVVYHGRSGDVNVKHAPVNRGNAHVTVRCC